MATDEPIEFVDLEATAAPAVGAAPEPRSHRAVIAGLVLSLCAALAVLTIAAPTPSAVPKMMPPAKVPTILPIPPRTTTTKLFSNQ